MIFDRVDHNPGNVLPAKGAKAFRFLGGIPRLVILHLNIEAPEVLLQQFRADFQRRRGIHRRKDDRRGKFVLLIVERLCKRVGFVAVLLQQFPDHLPFGVADAGTVVDHLIHSRFMHARKVSDLL